MNATSLKSHFKSTSAMRMIGAALGLMTAVFTSTANAGYTLTKIDPNVTDSSIASESSTDKQHWVYAPTNPTNRLALFFPGTDAKSSGYQEIAQALANAGMHVIVLKYVNETATHGLCDGKRQTDPNCFRKYRSEVVFGKNIADPDGNGYDSNKVTVSKQNSVMNRTLQLVDYLHDTDSFESQGWDQFQSATWNGTYSEYNPTWATVTTGGHSQGGGVALYLAKFYALDGVAMLSAPQDGWDENNSNYSPNWITEGGFDTNLSSIFGFDHETEESNMTAMQTTNWTALGLPGSIVDTDLTSPPYGSNRLQTSAPFQGGLCLVVRYHTSTAADICTPDGVHNPAWLYMFGN